MNYFKIYVKIVRRAYSNDAVNLDYYEKHHVFPVSIFGKNKVVVKLSYREHFICHKLLLKICEKRYGCYHTYTRKMYMAIHRMIYCSDSKIIKTSRLYDYARKCVVKSKLGKARLDMKGKRYFGASEETIKEAIRKMAEKKTGVKILNYPKNRKSAPCGEEKRQKISSSRKQTWYKFASMTDEEFWNWVRKCNKYGCYRGVVKPNHNVINAMKARGISLSEYYNYEDLNMFLHKKY